MTNKELRTQELPSGMGVVYQEGRPICKVRCNLCVQQEVLIARTLRGTATVPSLTDARGTLDVVEGEAWLMGGDSPLILELADKRRMEFFVTRPNPVTNSYQIVRTGGWLGSEK